MSNPSYSNIDLWLFELHEGNLSPEQVAKLEAFLMQHPELDVDKDMWNLAYVNPKKVVYPHQHKLQKRRAPFVYWSSAAVIATVFGLIVFFLMNDSQSVSGAETRSANLYNFNRNSNNVLASLKNSSTISNAEFSSENGWNKPEKTQFSLPFYESSEESIEEANNSYSSSNTGDLKSASEIGRTSIVAINNSPLNVSQNNSTPANSYMEGMNEMDVKPIHLTEMKRDGVRFKEKETTFNDWKLHRSHATKKAHSFSYSMRSLKRTIQKMADNPIALKNLKDPHYHVPGMQATDINFGAVGTLLATRVQTTSRYQWLGNKNEQLSNQLLIDGYAYAIRGGIGLQINQSNYHNNAYQSTFAAITYSPKFSVSKNVTVEPAIRFKMGNKSIQPSKLTVGEMVEFDRSNAEQFYSENETPSGKSLWYKDFGTSLMVNTKWFFAGVQLDNLAQHHTNIYGSQGTQRSPLHSVLTLGTDYESANRNLNLSPYIIYQKFGNLSEAWLGTNFRVKWFTIGAAVSSNSEPSASIGVKFKNFAMTYNADYTNSMMLSKSALSHQLTLRFITKPSRIGQRLLNY